MPPITTKATIGFAARKRPASAGLTALRISGAAQILTTPSRPMTTNQTSMTGPNSLPMLAVPRRWIRNSPTRIAIVTGTVNCSKCGAMSFRPSIADSTEIAGVMTPSP